MESFGIMIRGGCAVAVHPTATEARLRECACVSLSSPEGLLYPDGTNNLTMTYALIIQPHSSFNRSSYKISLQRCGIES